MERKNTILLTVIAVATLLVAVVGATFAYFTATSTTTGTGSGNVNTETAKVSSVTLDLNSQAGSVKYLDYPGGFGYTSIAVDASQTGDANGEYTLSYDIKLNFGNATTTDLKWNLYKVVDSTGSYSFKDNATCTLTQDTTTKPGETHFFYACIGEDTNNYGNAMVTSTNAAALGVAMDTTDTDLVSLAAGTTAKTVTISDSLATDEGKAYYYLVVYYENKNENQEDQVKQITAEIAGVENVKSVQKAA